MIEEWTLGMHRRATAEQQTAITSWLQREGLANERVLGIQYLGEAPGGRWRVELTMHEHKEDGTLVVTGEGEDAHIRHVGEVIDVATPPPFLEFSG